MAKKNQKTLVDELLEQALLPESEWPYRVPENWVWVKGIVLFETMTTRKPEGDYFCYIDIESIDNKRQIVNGTKKIKVSNAPSRASRELRVGDTLFSMVRPYLMNIAYIDDELSHCIASTGFYVCRPRKYLNSLFLYRMMTSNYVVDGLNSYMKGDNSPSIKSSDILEFCYPLPPVAEQLRIVERIKSLFEKLDNAKEVIESVLDSFDNRKSAIFHKAFSGEFTKNWREEEGINLSDWRFRRLCETDIDIIDGDRGANYPKKDEFTSSGYCLFLNAKNVTKNGFVFEKMEFISKERDEILRKGKLKRDDIVLTTRGTIGNVAYYDESVPYDNIRINSGMVIYRGGKDFHKPFLYWLYKSDYILSQIDNIKTGSAQPQLPIKIMKELVLPIPTVDEQRKIVEILESIFDKEENAKALIDVLGRIDVMKNTILSQAFRGKLGTNDDKEESVINLLGDIIQNQEGK